MSCFACFTTNFKHYHFENFTFTHSRRNTLDHHHHHPHHYSFTSRHSRRLRKDSGLQPLARRDRRRLSKKSVPRARQSSSPTAGYRSSFSDSSLGTHTLHGPSPLRHKILQLESPIVPIIPHPIDPVRQAPKPPARVSFAHVTVQRQVTSTSLPRGLLETLEHSVNL